jgi:hypothetical protein
MAPQDGLRSMELVYGVQKFKSDAIKDTENMFTRFEVFNVVNI